jgi:hypothetical protein
MRQHLIITTTALALTVSAWSASLSSGQYIGTSTARDPSVDGKSFAAEVGQERDTNFMKLVSLQPGENYYEEWVWDNTNLTVKQHTFIPGSQRLDHSIKHEVTQYGATISGGSYHIDCADRGLNDCDMGLDSRCFWTLTATADGFIWETWGPADQNAADNPIKLQTLTFKRAQ